MSSCVNYTMETSFLSALCPAEKKEGKTSFSLSDFRALLTGKISCQCFSLTNLWLDIRRTMFPTKQGLLYPLCAGFVWQIFFFYVNLD